MPTAVASDIARARLYDDVAPETVTARATRARSKLRTIPDGRYQLVSEAGDIAPPRAGGGVRHATPAGPGLRGGGTLTDTGRLRASISRSVSGPEVAVGTNLVYAAIHHFGGTIVPKEAGGVLAFTGADGESAAFDLGATPLAGGGFMQRTLTATSGAFRPFSPAVQAADFSLDAGSGRHPVHEKRHCKGQGQTGPDHHRGR